MLDSVENIDLDALFDSLNVAGTGAVAGSDPSKKSVLPNSEVENLEFQQMCATDLDLFLFDNPTDHS
jgi:hypothetical protein